MMLDEFKALDTLEGDQTEARMNYIATLLLNQNPHLRRGSDMSGPVCKFKNGVVPSAPKQHPLDFSAPDDGAIVTAETYKISVQELTGHPFISCRPRVAEANYLHMYGVQIHTPFGTNGVGDMIPVIPVIYGNTSFKVRLTKEVLDANTYIMARFAVSK